MTLVQWGIVAGMAWMFGFAMYQRGYVANRPHPDQTP